MARHIGMLTKIVAAYRTDAERAAIDFADLNWIEVIGYTMPGFIAKKYRFKCEPRLLPSCNEIEYLRENIIYAEGTIFFSFGETDAQKTKLQKIASDNARPFLHIDLSINRDLDALRLLKRFCEENSIKSLHITGSTLNDENCYKEVLNILDGLKAWGIQYKEEVSDFDEDLMGNDPDIIRTPSEVDRIYQIIEKDIDEISHYNFILNHSYKEDRKAVYTDNEIPYSKIYDPELYDESYYVHDAKVQSHLRATVIMLLFSKFEDWIDIICDAIQENRKIPISRSDLNGRPIHSFRRYLETFGRFKEPDANDWAVIDAIYDVRNVLVHGSGYIERAHLGSKKGITLLIQLNAGLKIDNANEYEKQRQLLIDHNNKIKEKSKIIIQTIEDLKLALYPNDQPVEVPPALKSGEKFPERIYLLDEFPKFAINKMAKLLKSIRKQHEQLYEKPRIIKSN